MNYDPNEPMKFEWCIGLYEGDKANYILSLANEGVGYFIRRTEGSGKGLRVEAAFRRPLDSPTPDHLMVADPAASIKLDRLFAERHSIRDDRPTIQHSPKAIDSLREVMEGIKHKNKKS
jgi:hypothetical protein